MSIQLTHSPVLPFRVTSKYGKRDTGIKGASTFHHGVDLGRDFSKSQTNIFSVADGTVKYNDWNDYRGWFVVIQHNGFQTLYQHMKSKCTIGIGTSVKSGTILGIMGNSSNADKLKIPVHLHFAICSDFSKSTEDSRGYINPLPYLQNIQPIVTKKEVEDLTEAETRQVVKDVINEILNNSNSTPSTWAKDAWEKAKKDGITDGSNPHGYITREQVITMLERLAR